MQPQVIHYRVNLETFSVEIPEENKKFMNGKRSDESKVERDDSKPQEILNFKSIWNIELPDDDNKVRSLSNSIIIME